MVMRGFEPNVRAAFVALGAALAAAEMERPLAHSNQLFDEYVRSERARTLMDQLLIPEIRKAAADYGVWFKTRPGEGRDGELLLTAANEVVLCGMSGMSGNFERAEARVLQLLLAAHAQVPRIPSAPDSLYRIRPTDPSRQCQRQC